MKNRSLNMLKKKRDCFNSGSRAGDIRVEWSKSHLLIVRDYFYSISKACDLKNVPDAIAKLSPLISCYSEAECSMVSFSAGEAAPVAAEIRRLFVVPKWSKLDWNQRGRDKNFQLQQAFLSFLLRLLHNKTNLMIDLCKDRIYNLEKELRFLLTILGHISLVHEHDSGQVGNLLEEFEKVENEAGSLVFSLLFSIDRGSYEKEDGVAGDLHRIDLLNDKIMEFFYPASSKSRQAHKTPKSSMVDWIRSVFSLRQAHKTPKSSMVDSLLSVCSLIDYLEDLMEGKDDRIISLMEHIKILHRGLKISKSSIERLGSLLPSEDGQLKEHVMRIGGLVREAEYLIISFLVGDAPSWYLINRLTKASYNIECIGGDLGKITPKNDSGELKVAEHSRRNLSLQSRKNKEVDGDTVGFDDREKYLLNELCRGEKDLQVIPIFGMPGIGKTTLAKKLHDHPLVHETFSIRLWCVPSETYQRTSALTDILNDLESQMGKSGVATADEDGDRIHKTLHGRRYLIVLDDVWDSQVLSELKIYFPDCKKGSRILLTTRNKDVAEDVASSDRSIFELQNLSSDRGWELLKKKVFATGTCPPDLIETGKKIVEKCGGLPLAIVVVAGILSTKDKKKSTWEEVCSNLASLINGGKNQVMQIMELSYKHLPEYLKPCFLYFGAFREGKEILIGKLLRLWISEGFIRIEDRKANGKTAEDVAEEYLLQLIDKSLVMVAKKRLDGGVRACVLHDLLHKLCFEKSKEESFFSFVKSDDLLIYEKGERIQLHRHHHRHVTTISCQYTRSLHGHLSPFYVRDMRLLRVLNCDSLSRVNMSGIEYLVNLRYLVISNLPICIDWLVNLEYLLLAAFEVVLLPSKIVKMRKLRYIQAPIGVQYDKESKFSGTSNLEYISRYWITEPKDEEMLKCSPHLRKLKCRYRPFSLGETVDLSFLTKLETLKIGPSRGDIKDINFPSSIKKLTLFRCPKDDIFNINSEIMSTIGRLENLEILKLRSISFEGRKWKMGEGKFKNLKVLKLCEVVDLNEWIMESSDYFPLLEQLLLKDCKNLQEIPLEFSEISMLEMIEVQGRCPKLVVESAKEIEQEKQKNGNVLRVIINVHSWNSNLGG